MSVWRNLLNSVLGIFFNVGEAAADAAVNKQDVGAAAENALKNTDPATLKDVEQAAEAVATKTVASVSKSKSK